MLIDTHVHIGRMINFDMKEEEVLYALDQYGVDFALVSCIEGAECDHKGRRVPRILQKKQNDVLKKTIRFARENPDRIGAMPWVKPLTEQPDDEFVRLIEDNRDVIYGIKLHPFHSKVAPDDERLESYYRIAAAYDLPVVSHTGGREEAMSIHLYNVAKAHPELRFVMVHMDLGTDNQQAIDLLGKLPNLYGDTTWVPVKSTLEAIRRCGSGKILFGSDMPIDGRDTYLHNRTGDRSLYQEYFNEFRDMVSAEDYDNVMAQNAQKLFHISIGEK